MPRSCRLQPEFTRPRVVTNVTFQGVLCHLSLYRQEAAQGGGLAGLGIKWGDRVRSTDAPELGVLANPSLAHQTGHVAQVLAE